MTTVSVVSNVLGKNDAAASENRSRMSAVGAVAVNVISAPGSGKTTLLESTISGLGGDCCAVLVGDLQTARDAERLAQATARTVQINTGKGCHLSADQVAAGLDELDLAQVSFVFIENVGNMVCPVSFDLGEHVRVALLSVPEGDDKVAKYHTLFQCADVILLTKTDLLGILDFDVRRVEDDLSQINTAAPLFRVSSKTGEGLDAWLDWLRGLPGSE